VNVFKKLGGKGGENCVKINKEEWFPAVFTFIASIQDVLNIFAITSFVAITAHALFHNQ